MGLAAATLAILLILIKVTLERTGALARLAALPWDEPWYVGDGSRTGSRPRRGASASEGGEASETKKKRSRLVA